jgi:mRNA interferase HigB
MRLFGKAKLDDFANNHADVRPQIYAWVYEVENAEWHNPNDIKARYVNASFLSDNIVIFNLKGNKYRLEVKITYKSQIVIVTRIGTHADYSKWTN